MHEELICVTMGNLKIDLIRYASGAVKVDNLLKRKDLLIGYNIILMEERVGIYTRSNLRRPLL